MGRGLANLRQPASRLRAFRQHAPSAKVGCREAGVAAFGDRPGVSVAASGLEDITFILQYR
eukprot:COSAG02_NODE_558_length_20348_cov_6.479431_8_plen_61_part_00